MIKQNRTEQEHEKFILEASILNPYAAEKQSSGMWGAQNKIDFFEKGRKSSLIEAVHLVQEGGLITANHFVNSKYFGFVIDELLSCLKQLDFDLFNSPSYFSEWELSSKRISAIYKGRVISTDYLYKLIVALRIKKATTKKIKKVLEIGAGAGTLARCIKQTNPSIKYYIIDLPGTLFFSYIFLRANFKNSSFKIITSKSQFLEIEDADFVFISAELLKDIPRWDIDLIINTHSLGEMSQEMVHSYMEMIQNHLNVKYLYSLNRFLQIPEDIDVDAPLTYQASVSTIIDPFWKVEMFNYCPDFVKSMRYEPDTRTTLEILLEREKYREQGSNVIRSKQFLNEARQEVIKSDKWLALMWKSVYLNPTKENLLPYYEYLTEINARDRFFYYELLKNKVDISIHNPYQEITKNDNHTREYVARKWMGLSRRIHRFIKGS